jgi:hypothetical protein
MRHFILLIAAIAAAEFPTSLTLAAPRTPAQSAAGSATCTDKTSQCWDAVSKQMRQCMIRTCTYGDGHTTSGGLVSNKRSTTTVGGTGANPPSSAGTNKEPTGPTGTHPIVGVSSPVSAGTNKGPSGGGTTTIEKSGGGGKH